MRQIIISGLLLAIQHLSAGGHLEYGYAYIRNYTPYTLVLHALQETQWVDKVPQVWYVAPNSTQMLGKVDTLNATRFMAELPDNANIPNALRGMTDIVLPQRHKNDHLLISISLDQAANDRWIIGTQYVKEVTTFMSGTSGYNVQVEIP